MVNYGNPQNKPTRIRQSSDSKGVVTKIHCNKMARSGNPYNKAITSGNPQMGKMSYDNLRNNEIHSENPENKMITSSSNNQMRK